MDSEVPCGEVDLVVVEDFDDAVFTEEKALGGDEFEPVVARERGSGSRDEVLFPASGVIWDEGEAGDDTDILADVDADDGVAAVTGIVVLVFFLDCRCSGSTVGVDGEDFAGGSLLVVETDVEGWVGDMELDGGLFAFEFEHLVAAGVGVEDGGEDGVAGLAVEVAVGLGEGDEFGGSAEGVKCKDHVFGDEAEVGSDFGGECGAGGLFFGELRIKNGCCALRDTIGIERGGMELFPLAGGFEIDEVEGDFFGLVISFGAEKLDAVADDFVAEDKLVGSVFEDESSAARRDGCLGGRVGVTGGKLGCSRCWEGQRGEQDGDENCARHDGPLGDDSKGSGYFGGPFVKGEENIEQKVF